ncbi:MFS transporter [Niallia circulans]|jgi:MFS transporter, DHA3 family, macrolide efflux protein|uniref:MFS transporter n=1 Tax=Niallia circulans TaxID=1397 RepID=A0A0J1II61_NIACI|nr:MFS transporter [Niallia circulans]KLV25617.1 MFS transporter [Niallia circulans]MCM2982777.1 MFS transporter [Niallia circulans]MDR4315952.1 MFS transporter [Niallia circulans]MED3841234.1 MFS transporter [Niallia circulans]MED4244786.1 MFS transporter [Niallia circulans]
MKKFAEIFKNTSFTRLFIANVTSQMGSVIGLTAFMFYILDRFSEQPAYATVTELMFSLPTLAVFFLVGVVADRMDRQKIAYYCEMIAAVLSLFVLGAVLIGWMPLIFMMLFLRSAVQKFFFPAEQGILQGVLKKDDFTTAAGLNQLVNSIFMLFGNAIGIFVYWTLGIYGAILVDVATLTISGLLIKSMKLDETVRKPNGSHTLKELNIRFIWSDFMIGLKYILTNKLLMALIYGFIAFGVVNGGFSVMQVFILKYKLAPDNYEQVSIYFGIVFGAGVMIGSFLSSLLAQKVKLYKLIITGAFYIAIMTILASYSPNILVFLTICFFLALGLPLINIAIGGWMPTIIEPKMMGRVQGWITPLMMLSQSITLGLISIGYPKWFSIEIIYWFVGACFLLVGFYYSLVLPKLAKEKEAKDAIAGKEEVQLNY